MSALSRRLLASTVLAAALSLPAAAQDVRDLDRETSNVRSFPAFVGAEPARFEVSLPAGSSLIVDAVSTSSIDPFLTVSDARSGDVIGEDDDSGGDLNSQVTIRPSDRNRRLAIEVKQFSFGDAEGDGTGGSFDLKLTSFVPAPAQDIGWGETVESTVELGGENNYRFMGEPGMVLEVAMIAAEDSSFDPYLRLLDEAGDELTSDDDGGDGLNSMLTYLMTDDSELTIVASGYGDAAGQFTLRVGARREPIVQAPLQVVGLADEATGRLGAGYEAGGIDPLSIDYQLSEEALAAIAGGADELTVKMTAKVDDDGLGGGLDSYLEIGFDTPLGFAVVDSDDDSGGDLDAMIPLDLSGVADDPGLLSRLRIRAQAFSGSTGDYVLTITEGMEVRQASEDELPPPILVAPSG